MFGLDGDAVPKELLMLVGQHRLILHVFDRCLDGKLFEPPNVKHIAERALGLYGELLLREGLADQATAVEKSW